MKLLTFVLLAAMGMSGQLTQTNSGVCLPRRDGCNTCTHCNINFAGTAPALAPAPSGVIMLPYEGDCFKLRSGVLEKIDCPVEADQLMTVFGTSATNCYKFMRGADNKILAPCEMPELWETAKPKSPPLTGQQEIGETLVTHDMNQLIVSDKSAVDIPAVQEKLPESEDNPCNVTIVKNQGKIGKLTVTDPTVNCDQPHKSRWTCTDKSRSLETSVDGKSHWCHRIEP